MAITAVQLESLKSQLTLARDQILRAQTQNESLEKSITEAIQSLSDIDPTITVENVASKIEEMNALINSQYVACQAILMEWHKKIAGV